MNLVDLYGSGVLLQQFLLVVLLYVLLHVIALFVEYAASATFSNSSHVILPNTL